MGYQFKSKFSSIKLIASINSCCCDCTLNVLCALSFVENGLLKTNMPRAARMTKAYLDMSLGLAKQLWAVQEKKAALSATQDPLLRGAPALAVGGVQPVGELVLSPSLTVAKIWSVVHTVEGLLPGLFPVLVQGSSQPWSRFSLNKDSCWQVSIGLLTK